MNKPTIIFFLLAFLYITWHFGRYYEAQLTERKIDNAIEQRLANCITTDYHYLATDWCLYGQGGYITPLSPREKCEAYYRTQCTENGELPDGVVIIK